MPRERKMRVPAFRAILGRQCKTLCLKLGEREREREICVLFDFIDVAWSDLLAFDQYRLAMRALIDTHDGY